MTLALILLVGLTVFALLSNKVNTDTTTQIIALYLIGAGALLRVLGTHNPLAFIGISLYLYHIIRCAYTRNRRANDKP